MTARELVELWVQRFNDSDYQGLGQLYHENAVNHQTATGFIRGKINFPQSTSPRVNEIENESIS